MPCREESENNVARVEAKVRHNIPQAHAPSCVSLMSTVEKEMGFMVCGASPSWPMEGNKLVAGGLCKTCTRAAQADSCDLWHCENCGVLRECWDWKMIAVHDRVCAHCAYWYIGHAPLSRMWANASAQRARMRGVVWSLMQWTCQEVPKGVISTIVDEMLTSRGSFWLVPVSHGPVLAWGWLLGVIAASAASHPAMDADLLGQV